MYIQITSRCNMRCAHCCFACTQTGQDMSFATFKTALGTRIFNMTSEEINAQENLTIGGGEPLLHPRFKGMLKFALANWPGFVCVITNGTKEATSLWLLRQMDKHNNLGAYLSADSYHDRSLVSDTVYEAYTRAGRVRLRCDEPLKMGRAARWPQALPPAQVPWPDVFVQPNGEVSRGFPPRYL